MYRIAFTLSFVFAILTSIAAQAQNTPANIPPDPYPRYTPNEAPHFNSSTLEEGVLRGTGVLITSYGDYLRNESLAAYNWQLTESLAYDNEMKRVATAFEIRRIKQAYRAQERQQRLNQKVQSKQLWEQTYLDLAKSYRLDEFEFNWNTGQINWPASLAGPRYVDHRNRLNLLMSRMVQYGGQVDEFLRDDIAEACKAFRDQLRKEDVKNNPETRTEYIAMQKFLLGLKYSPYLAAGQDTVGFLTASAR